MRYPVRIVLAMLLLGVLTAGPVLAETEKTEGLVAAETPLFIPKSVDTDVEKQGEKPAAAKKEVSDKKDAAKKEPAVDKQPEQQVKNKDAKQGKQDKKEQEKQEDKGILVVDEPPLDRALTDADFSFKGLRAGDSLQQVKRIFGSPTKYAQSAHFTELKYNQADLKMTVRLRNETAQVLKEEAEGRKAVRPGVDSITLAAGDDVYIGPGIHLGHPAELLVRKYGRPQNVLRDADANVYYFVYESPGKDHVLVFAIGERKVARVALMPPRPPYVEHKPVQQTSGWTPRDFTLIGYGVDEPFVANKYNMWTNLVKRDENKYWLYDTYGVEVDRYNQVKKVFLLNNSSYTGRGATLGYNLSTIFALYGTPSHIEKGPDGDQYVDAYYYDSPFQKGVSLVFVNKHHTDYIDDILLVNEPIKNLQDPMGRYGLK